LVHDTPGACFDALTDFERLPAWQGAVRSVRVLERDAQGRGTVVEYEVDAKLKRVRYRLRQVYDRPRGSGASTWAAISVTSPVSGASSEPLMARRSSSSCASIRAGWCRGRSVRQSPTR